MNVDMKKVDMAEAAEQSLATTAWRSLRRTAKPENWAAAPNEAQGGDAYSQAAE